MPLAKILHVKCVFLSHPVAGDEVLLKCLHILVDLRHKVIQVSLAEFSLKLGGFLILRILDCCLDLRNERPGNT